MRKITCRTVSFDRRWTIENSDLRIFYCKRKKSHTFLQIIALTSNFGHPVHVKYVCMNKQLRRTHLLSSLHGRRRGPLNTIFRSRSHAAIAAAVLQIIHLPECGECECCQGGCRRAITEQQDVCSSATTKHVRKIRYKEKTFFLQIFTKQLRRTMVCYERLSQT